MSTARKGMPAADQTPVLAWEKQSNSFSVILALMLFFLFCHPLILADTGRNRWKRKETIMEDIKNTEQAQNTQPAGNGDKGQRMFTQEEVNRIVGDRLAKVKAANAEQAGEDLARKAADLTARENRLTCREYLAEKEYPTSLLDVIDTSDPEKFREKAEAAARLINDAYTAGHSAPVAPLASTEGDKGFHVALPDGKHTPRQYPVLSVD